MRFEFSCHSDTCNSKELSQFISWIINNSYLDTTSTNFVASCFPNLSLNIYWRNINWQQLLAALTRTTNLLMQLLKSSHRAVTKLHFTSSLKYTSIWYLKWIRPIKTMHRFINTSNDFEYHFPVVVCCNRIR